MPLEQLALHSFRNFNDVNIYPIANGFNFLYGNNGSGKTSLLEAIYYLSRGRSFRSSNFATILQYSAEKFAIFAQVQANQPYSIPIGVERPRRGEMRIRLNGQDCQSFAEIAPLTPTLLINSNCFSLLDSGPLFRRKYLDWGAFYTLPEFLPKWKQYERTLKQRNAALRSRVTRKELTIWNQELVLHGLALDECRKRFVALLLPFLTTALTELIEIPELNIHYQSGWQEGLNFADVLEQSVEKDWVSGHTTSGPHRADLKLTINGTLLKDILSRGQQKLFVCAMIVAQGALLRHCINRELIYLIDDLPSELDNTSRTKLISLLAQQHAQVFMTAVEKNGLIDFLESVPVKMFHVEHGKIKDDC